MNSETQEHRPYGFMLGLVAGTLVGAALAVWLASDSASELRGQVRESTRKLGARASNGYRQTAARIEDAMDDLAEKGQAIRDDVAAAVARGAHEIERQAKAARSGTAHS